MLNPRVSKILQKFRVHISIAWGKRLVARGRNGVEFLVPGLSQRSYFPRVTEYGPTQRVLYFFINSSLGKAGRCC